MTCPEALPDGTKDGDGFWHGGRWHLGIRDGRPDGKGGWEPYLRDPEEQRYSQRVRTDKYREMQDLLLDLAHSPHAPDARPALDEWQKRAQRVMTGMRRPWSPAVRGTARANELRILAEAYETAAAAEKETATLLIEALKAWERAHPPAPLDPLLLDPP
jgi:hypothetical protein